MNQGAVRASQSRFVKNCLSIRTKNNAYSK
jgi:hypothetical protein